LFDGVVVGIAIVSLSYNLPFIWTQPSCFPAYRRTQIHIVELYKCRTNLNGFLCFAPSFVEESSSKVYLSLFYFIYGTHRVFYHARSYLGLTAALGSDVIKPLTNLIRNINVSLLDIVRVQVRRARVRQIGMVRTIHHVDD
jgi:hypothetical protein